MAYSGSQDIWITRVWIFRTVRYIYYFTVSSFNIDNCNIMTCIYKCLVGNYR